jgi:protein phosphatase methylesterase 1
MAIHATLALPKGKVQALIVLDVVEGTAMAALPEMMKIVYARPQKFADVKSAIFWAYGLIPPSSRGSVLTLTRISVSNNIVRNTESASVSIPPQLREEDGAYFWKTDLEETSKYWKGTSASTQAYCAKSSRISQYILEWFTNMSNLFLSAPAMKLLILAGVDRLDGTLTMAQMQGKFQMSVLPSVGHSIQEDVRFVIDIFSSNRRNELMIAYCRLQTTARSKSSTS